MALRMYHNPRCSTCRNTLALLREVSEGGPQNRHSGADQWLYVLSGAGLALVNGERHTLTPGTLMLIEQKDQHEVKNTGSELLRTLNFYVPPAYTESGAELPPAKP